MRFDLPKGFFNMKHLFFAVVLLGLLCSCAHTPEPLFACRFHTEKDAFMPNGWRFREDEHFAKPLSFLASPFADKKDEKANLFTVKTGEQPALNYYSGCYEIEDDSIIEVVADAAGQGSFSLGVELLDQDKNPIRERYQGFELIPVNDDKTFKSYCYRLYFLANENAKARYARLMYIVDPSTTLTLRDISLDVTPYEINRMDSTYIKFKEKEKKEGYRE